MKLIIALLLLSFGAQAGTLEIMSYNVENLFDSTHDEGKVDWSFLPKDTPGKKEACAKERSKYRRQECLEADWTQKKVEMKLQQIVDVITKERKGTPDILGLIEVENPNVVGQLAKKLGYEHFEMTTSPDNRGVDVALLYKENTIIKKISKTEHHVAVDYPSRNILEVAFTINGSPLTVFVNHWPSLANPDSWRIKAAEVLANRTKEIAKTNKEMSFIAIGDFNTIPENNPHPFKTVIHKDNLYLDTAESFLASKDVSDEAKKKLSKGTYYFAPKDQWNMLDRIFYSQNLIDGKELEIDIKTFEIYLPEFALKEQKRLGETKPKLGGYELDDDLNMKVFKVPLRFNSDAKVQSKMGFSDHFAVVVKLNFPDKKK